MHFKSMLIILTQGDSDFECSKRLFIRKHRPEYTNKHLITCVNINFPRQ